MPFIMGELLHLKGKSFQVLFWALHLKTHLFRGHFKTSLWYKIKAVQPLKLKSWSYSYHF